jgi:ribosomal protein S18 acetylase RimI-like enzyme
LSDGMNNPSAYIDSIEKNLTGFYSIWADAMNIPVQEKEGMRLVYQQGKPWPAFGLFPEIQAGQEVEFVTKLTREISAGAFPPFLVCSDQGKNKTLMQCLENAGFRPVTIWSGMARDVMQPVQIDEIKGFQVKIVEDLPQASQFAQLINREVLRASYLDGAYLQPPGLSSFHAFTGSVAGQVCSTSSVYCQDGTAGLYFIATLPAMRRKGFGKRMTILAMQEAQLFGCQTLVLHATRAGKALYEQLGFIEYCRLIIYWLPG